MNKVKLSLDEFRYINASINKLMEKYKGEIHNGKVIISQLEMRGDVFVNVTAQIKPNIEYIDLHFEV